MSREQFEAQLRSLGAQNSIINAATSIGGRSAVNEVLAEGLADALLGEHALVQQIRAIEEGLKRIPTGGAVTYGMDSIANATQQGAVEALVIVASMLRSGDDASRVRWEDIVAQIEASRGSVIQASTDHDAGQQLVGLGGAIALLRWKVE
jgi:protein pelota